MGIGLNIGLNVGKVIRSGLPAIVASLLLGTLPSYLTLNRPSLATMYDTAGKITFCPNNLCPFSTNLTDASWTKTSVNVTAGIDDPFGGTNAFRVTATAVAGKLSKQGAVVPIGTRVINSIWVRRAVGVGQVTLITVNNTNFTITPTGSWQRIQVPVTLTIGGNPAIGALITVSGDALDLAFPQSEAVTYQTSPSAYNPTMGAAAYYGPRFDQIPGTSTPKGLMFEASAATNVLTITEAIAIDTTNWQATNLTIPTTTAFGLFGGASLYTLTQTLALTPSQLFLNPSRQIAAVNGNFVTASVALLAGTYDQCTFGIFGITSAWGLIGSSTCTIISGPGVAVQEVGAYGRFRISGLDPVTPTVVSITRAVLTTENMSWNLYTQVTAAGAAGDSIKFGITQFELAVNGAASVATSYIPSGTSSTTRSGETFTITGAPLAYLKAGTFTVFSEAQSRLVPSSSRIMGNQGSSTVLTMSADTIAQNFDPTAGSVTATQAGGNKWTTIARMGLAQDISGRAIVMTGGTVVTSATRWTPSAAQIGVSPQSNAWLRNLAFYATRLPNAALQAASIVGASYP